MHYYALVAIPKDADDIKTAVDEAMAPYSEEVSEDGWWDWYSIGGRWTGKLDGYDPTTDRRNMEVCFLCRGSGRRDDGIAAAWRAEHPEYGCNGCESTGIQIKHASSWVKRDADVSYRGLLDDNHQPFTLVANGRVTTKETWNGKDFIDTTGEHSAHWAGLDPDTRLVVVDYHC